MAQPRAVLPVTSPLIAAFVTRGSAFGKSLPELEAGQSLKHLTLHWQVGQYGELDPAHNYNAETYNVGGNWLHKMTHDPRANAVTLTKDSPDGSYAAHTFEHNSHNFGAAVAAMWGATPGDFGQYAVKMPETESYLAMCAGICAAYNLDAVDSTVVRTHAEWAIEDGYFPGDGDPDARWDWARDVASPLPLTVDEANATAQRMRHRMQKYLDDIRALWAVK